MNFILNTREIRLSLMAFAIAWGAIAVGNAAELTLQAPGTSTRGLQLGEFAREEEKKVPDVIFVPTPQALVERMLVLAEVNKDDVVYDLGCGDGRIVVTAAKKYGVKAVGFDIDPERIQEALANVKSNKVEHLVTIKQADIFKLDLTPASVVTLYLLPELNVRLMPQLRKLKPGSRIVSHEFDMRGAKPAKVEQVNLNPDQESEQDSGEHTLYKWVVPWESETRSE
ncbi:MAG: cyclopropane-fatty-acyl-phospholipid synthase family protein [Verrucomicrobiia bacterium]